MENAETIIALDFYAFDCGIFSFQSLIDQP